MGQYSYASLFKRTICLLSTVIVVKDHFFEVAICSGESMIPTINSHGDILLIDKIALSRESLKHGDIVTLISPSSPSKTICKRIVGLEGDCISLTETLKGNVSLIRIPEGHIWVEGDNAKRSLDSRAFGPVPIGLVQGKAALRIWPPSLIGGLSKHPVANPRIR